MPACIAVTSFRLLKAATTSGSPRISAFALLSLIDGVSVDAPSRPVGTCLDERNNVSLRRTQTREQPQTSKGRCWLRNHYRPSLLVRLIIPRPRDQRSNPAPATNFIDPVSKQLTGPFCFPLIAIGSRPQKNARNGHICWAR